MTKQIIPDFETIHFLDARPALLAHVLITLRVLVLTRLLRLIAAWLDALSLITTGFVVIVDDFVFFDQ